MNNVDAKIFAAQLDNKTQTLDLHGLYIDEALEKIELFLFENFEKNNDTVLRIIYGGGTGKLGNAVNECLKQHKLVKKIVKDFGCCFVVI